MSTSPEWFKWIKPAPQDEEERRAILDVFGRIVEAAKHDSGAIDLVVFAREQKNRARQFRNAAKALADLPAVYRDSDLFRGMRDDFSTQAAEADALAKRWGRSKKGRPQDWAKASCWLACFQLLSDFDRDVTPARGGTIPGLAQAAWFLATGESYSLDAWAETGKRSLPKLFEAYQRKRKPG